MRRRLILCCALVLSLQVVACDDGGSDPVDASSGEDARVMDAGGGRRDGSVARCGDGQVDDGEECDDANRLDDDGCSSTCQLECGDGVVSGDELCDTGIAAGAEGACPTSCDDGIACTSDTLSGSACAAECVHGDITATADDDGCCPDGANASTDNDCAGSCGDGFVTGTEICDTAIAEGTVGACPTTCDDGVDCTDDELQNAGTCEAVCVNTAITTPGAADACCPTGATLADDPDCAIACGDGVVSAGETCDTGIASGPGACPSDCDDGIACTTDMLANAGTCTAACTSVAITTPADGDGCCPAGATIANDDDCTATCGDGVVAGGESCDTGITSGPGACPTSCSDGISCTSDVLTGAGTCAATCSYPAITAPVDGDQCCPTGANIGNDSDCPVVCGDGVRSPSEACDVNIPAGTAGACPAAGSCSDGNACTTDTLVNAGTCNAMCTFPAITTPTHGDGCCPTGATIGNDDDCAARCGDGVITAPETCDDGNTADGDGCSASCTTEVTPTAFRVTSLALRDPHAFASVLIFCNDITGQLNTQLSEALTMDGDDPADGMLDLNMVQVFRPLAQGNGSTTESEIVFPECTAPQSSTMCSLPVGATRAAAAVTSRSTGTCLGPITGTVRPYNPAVTPATGPCYESQVGDLVINLGGINLTLRQTRVGATYSGTPATRLINGVIRGFLTEADANATTLPADLPVVGGQTLASVLRGGSGNCQSGSDMDTLEGTSTRGWYFYLNFEATAVPYTEL